MPTAGVREPSAAFQPTSGTSGSWMWTTSYSPLRSSPRMRAKPPAGETERLETAPLAPMPTVRPNGTT